MIIKSRARSELGARCRINRFTPSENSPPSTESLGRFGIHIHKPLSLCKGSCPFPRKVWFVCGVMYTSTSGFTPRITPFILSAKHSNRLTNRPTERSPERFFCGRWMCVSGKPRAGSVTHEFIHYLFSENEGERRRLVRGMQICAITIRWWRRVSISLLFLFDGWRRSWRHLEIYRKSNWRKRESISSIPRWDEWVLSWE